MRFNKKVLTILIALCILAISMYFIISTYAKYITTASGSASVAISRWYIEVNDQDILSNSDISSTLTPVFPGNAYIAANIIAPAAEGYFDLELDYTQVDVAFTYTITAEPVSGSAVTDLTATGYSTDNGVNIHNFASGTRSISKTVLLGDSHAVETIRLYVKWDDDPTTETMNNFDDALSANTANNNAEYLITVSFIQITGNTSS